MIAVIASTFLILGAFSALLLSLRPNVQTYVSAQEQPAPTVQVAEVNPDVLAARRLMNYGDYILAEERLTKALAKDPKNVSVLLELARNLRFDNPPRSLDYAKRALAQAPTDIEALILTGSGLSIVGGKEILADDPQEVANGATKLVEAQKLADKAIELDEKSAEARRLAADIAWRRSFEQLDDKEADAANMKMWLQTSLAHTLAAVSLDPDDRETKQRLALLYLDLDDPIKFLDTLGPLDPETESYTIAEARARVCLMVSPPLFTTHADCIKVMRKEHDTAEMQVIESISRIAAIQAKAGSPEFAAELVAVCRDACEVGPADRLAILKPYLPTLDRSEERFRPIIPQFCFLAALAQSDIASRLDNPEETLKLRLNAVWLLKNMGLNEAQQHGLEEMLPFLPQAAAFLYASTGDWASAEKNFKRYAKLVPEDKQSQVFALLMPEIAKSRLKLNHVADFLDIREARITSAERIRRLENLLADVPRFALARSFLATLLYENSANELARTHLLEVTKVWPDFEDALLTLGRAELQLRMWQEALDTFTKLNGISKNYGGSADLAEFARRVVSGSLPGDAMAAYLQSLPGALNNEIKATLLDKAILLAPSFSEALADRSLLASSEGHAELALSYGMRALEAAATDAQRSAAESALAEASVAANELARASGHYRKARELEPRGTPRHTSLTHIESLILTMAGNHRESSTLLSTLTKPEFDRIYKADRDAAHMLLASVQAASAVDTERPAFKDLTMKIGQFVRFHGKIRLSVEGGRVDSSAEYDVGVMVECLGTPELLGAWQLRVSIDVPSDFEVKGIHGLAFPITISPWHGITATPKEVADLESASQVIGNLIVQSICEVFAGGLGLMTLKHGEVFGRKSIPGLLHVEGADEASVCRLEKGEIATERLAIDDYRDKVTGDAQWAPRKRVSALAARDADTGLPRRVELRSDRQVLMTGLMDVEITRVGIFLEAQR